MAAVHFIAKPRRPNKGNQTQGQPSFLQYAFVLYVRLNFVSETDFLLRVSGFERYELWINVAHATSFPLEECLALNKLHSIFSSSIKYSIKITLRRWGRTACSQNSSIIHQVKTKEITTVKEVWIPGLNQQGFLRFYFSLYSWVLFRLRRYIKHSRQCFIAIQTPRILSKILRCASYFQLSSRCFDILMKHCRSCLIYYFKLGFRSL